MGYGKVQHAALADISRPIFALGDAGLEKENLKSKAAQRNLQHASSWTVRQEFTAEQAEAICSRWVNFSKENCRALVTCLGSS